MGHNQHHIQGSRSNHDDQDQVPGHKRSEASSEEAGDQGGHSPPVHQQEQRAEETAKVYQGLCGLCGAIIQEEVEWKYV